MTQPSSLPATVDATEVSFDSLRTLLRRRLVKLEGDARSAAATLATARAEARKLKGFFDYVEEPCELPEILRSEAVKQKRQRRVPKDPVVCELCQRSFVGALGLATHRSRAHGGGAATVEGL